MSAPSRSSARRAPPPAPPAKGARGRGKPFRARVALDAERLQQRLLGAEESHCEQDEFGLARLLRARDRRERRLAAVLHPVDPLDPAVAGEPCRRDREVALAALLERVRRAQL